jgi:hypothetical protein
MATADAELEVPGFPNPEAPTDTCLVEFHTVGHSQRAVSVDSTITLAQAENIKGRLERSWLIGKVTPFRRGGSCSLQVSARWHTPWRMHIYSKIEQAILRELKATKGCSRIHHPIPGQPGDSPRKIKTRTFRAKTPPSVEHMLELASHA